MGNATITWAEVEARTRRAPFDLLADGCEEMAAVVLDDMIDEELLLREGERRGVTVPSAVVADALGDLARGLNFPSTEALIQYSERRGTSHEELRERVSRRVLADRVLRAALPAVRVTAQDLRSIHRWRALSGAARIQVLFIEARRTDDTAYASARLLGQSLVARARRGADFCELAAEFGSAWWYEDRTCDWPRTSGSNLYDQVWSARAESAFELKAGVVSDPLEETAGIFILRVADPGPSLDAMRVAIEREAGEYAVRRMRSQFVAGLRRATPPRLEPRERDYVARIRNWRLNRQICTGAR